MKRILATEKKIGEVEKDLNSNLDELGGIEKVSFVFLSCLILFFAMQPVTCIVCLNW